jgi:hypothetical protein
MHLVCHMFRTGEVFRSTASGMMQKRAMMKRKTTERKLKLQSSPERSCLCTLYSVSTFYLPVPATPKREPWSIILPSRSSPRF